MKDKLKKKRGRRYFNPPGKQQFRKKSKKEIKRVKVYNKIPAESSNLPPSTEQIQLSSPTV